MYLTRLRLDPHNAQARRDLADPYDMHRTLVRAFVRDEREAPPRILWRLEPSQAWDDAVVLVQSRDAGDWSFLAGSPGYLQAAEDALCSKAFEPAGLAQQGAVVRFRLAANPTVTRAGKRIGLVGEDSQLEWLGRQGQRHGFDLRSALVCAGGRLHGRKGSTRMTVLRVLFEGFLEVRDTESLTRAIVDGIGPGKAFGCGMLSLARPS